MDNQPNQRELEYKRALQLHNGIITGIKEIESRFDSLSPFELSKLEYKYSQAEKLAWKIAGYFRGEAKYYEGMAEVAQGTTYKNLRKEANKTSVDAQYESRIAKGNCLIEAGLHDGDYTSWKGFATSYEGARNAIKDMIKAISTEGGTQSA